MVEMPDQKGQGIQTLGRTRVCGVMMHVGDRDRLPGVQEAGGCLEVGELVSFTRFCPLPPLLPFWYVCHIHLLRRLL